MVAARARREFGDVATDGGDVGEDRAAARRIVVGPALEGAGHGAHAAGDVGGHELRDEIKKEFRVGEAFRRRPIRRVDLLLHPRAVKTAVGKSVDRENVAVVNIQPAAEGGESAGCASSSAARAPSRRPIAYGLPAATRRRTTSV